MNIREEAKELFIILLASIVLALTVSFNKTDILLEIFLSFIIIIGANILIKKYIGYRFETRVTTKLWSWYRYGFRKDAHFKRPIPMLWIPLVISLFSKGFLWWISILEFDVEAKTERVSRRHGLYRFTEVTEYHIGLIALGGVITNLIIAIIAYLIGFEFFAKLSIYYAFWSIIPLSSWDGSKILFAGRGIWITIASICLIFVVWAMSVL